MKIKREHLEHYKNLILPKITPEIISAYETGNFPRSNLCKELQTRFMFDMSYLFANKFVCEVLYSYMNDVHIETALRSFMPKVERKF